MIAIVPAMGLNFAFYEYFKQTLNALNNSRKEKSIWKSGLAGGLAGGLSKLIVFPLVIVLLMFLSFDHNLISSKHCL
jgi:hypothetical protein